MSSFRPIRTKLNQFNYTKFDIKSCLLHEFFEEIAKVLPDKIAAKCNDQIITYSDLNFRANQLAHYLIYRNIKAGDFIGISIKRSIDLLVAVLGVLKSGACYLPIDPVFPTDRIEYMLLHSGTILLITEKSLTEKYSKISISKVFIDSVLRLVISKNLNIRLLEILFENEFNQKTYIKEHPLYFNITNTRDAFAFAVSMNHNMGIDMEKLGGGMDFFPIIETYFSNKERKYILEVKADARARFFLLWTSKEALLKALGTGILTDLTQIEVSEKENIIQKKWFSNLVWDSVCKECFIYSKKWYNFILSIKVPQKSEIIFNKLTLKNIESYLV